MHGSTGKIRSSTKKISCTFCFIYGANRIPTRVQSNIHNRYNTYASPLHTIDTAEFTIYLSTSFVSISTVYEWKESFC